MPELKPEQKSEQKSEGKPEQTTYFGESNETDPTPGWIPFVFVLAIAIVFLVAFVVVAMFVG